MNKRLSMDKGAWRALFGPTRARRGYEAWRTIPIDSPKSMKLQAHREEKSLRFFASGNAPFQEGSVAWIPKAASTFGSDARISKAPSMDPLTHSALSNSLTHPGWPLPE